jgi:DNA-binding IclR family transcriptional regulator
MNSIFMGYLETRRYKVLKALNEYRALSYSNLSRKSGIGLDNLKNVLKSLVEERIVIRWDFGVYYVIYSHSFVSWYEVEDIYKRKYSILSRASRNKHRRRLIKEFEYVLKC